jgi:hypothetical protein
VTFITVLPFRRTCVIHYCFFLLLYLYLLHLQALLSAMHMSHSLQIHFTAVPMYPAL